MTQIAKFVAQGDQIRLLFGVEGIGGQLPRGVDDDVGRPRQLLRAAPGGLVAGDTPGDGRRAGGNPFGACNGSAEESISRPGRRAHHEVALESLRYARISPQTSSGRVLLPTSTAFMAWKSTSMKRS